MANWCASHPCDFGRGGKVCMNCGAEKPPAPIVIAAGIDETGKAFEVAAAVPAVTIDPVDGQTIAKATNPKDAIGSGKLPMHLVPTAVQRYAALAFAEGAFKYGKYNWRVAGVRISIYLDAIHRHLSKLQDGEWADGDSNLDETGEPNGTQVPHLASIIACCGIILDAMECDKLVDDRPPVNLLAGRDMDTRLAHIAHLRKMFEKFTPHQHVITDAPQA